MDKLTSNLLERARSLLNSTRRGYRDGMIEVGRILRQFVVARLSLGDGLPEVERIRRRINRQTAIVEAANALNCKILKINELIRLGAAADLLAPPGGFGPLSYAAVRAMRVIIERPNKGKGKISRVRDCSDGLLSLSSIEQWIIKPGYENAARELVVDAVVEAWDEIAVTNGLRALLRRPARQEDKRYPYTAAVRYADVCELADQAINLILAADNPEEVLGEIRARLDQIGRGSRPDPYERERNRERYERKAGKCEPLFVGD